MALTNEDLSLAIENAFRYEWRKRKGATAVLPDVGSADRKMLFDAIARGVLNYLNAHSELVTQIQLAPTTATSYQVYNAVIVDLNITVTEPTLT